MSTKGKGIELGVIKQDIELGVMKGQGQGGGGVLVKQEDDYDDLLVPKKITGSISFGKQLQLISEHCEKKDSKFTRDEFHDVLTAELFQSLYKIDELEQVRSELQEVRSELGNDPDTSLITRYGIYNKVREDIEQKMTYALGIPVKSNIHTCMTNAIDAFLNRFDTYLSIHILCMPFIIEIIKLYKYLYSKTYIQIEENQFAYLTACLDFVSVSGKQAINKLYLGAFNTLHKLLNNSNATEKEELVKNNMFEVDYQAIQLHVLQFSNETEYHKFPILSEYDMFHDVNNMLTRKIETAYNSANFRKKADSLVVNCNEDPSINGTYVVYENQQREGYPIFMCQENSTTIEFITSEFFFKRNNKLLYMSNYISDIYQELKDCTWFTINEDITIEKHIAIIIQYKKEAEEAEKQRKAEEAEMQRKAAEEAETLRKAAEEAKKQRKAAEEEAEKQRKAVEEAERQRKAAAEEAERQRKEAETLKTAVKLQSVIRGHQTRKNLAKDDRKKRKQIDEILLNDICEAPNYDPTIGTVLTEEFFNSLGDCQELRALNDELLGLEQIDERIFYGDISVDATKNLSLMLEKKEEVVNIFNRKIKEKMGKIRQNELLKTCIQRAVTEFNSRFEPYLNIHIVWMPFFKQIIQLNRCLYSRTYELMMPNKKEVPTTAFNLLNAYLDNMSGNEILNYYRVIRNIIKNSRETAIMFDTDREKIKNWLQELNGVVFRNFFNKTLEFTNIGDLKNHLNWQITRVINAEERRKNAKPLVAYNYMNPNNMICKLIPSQYQFEGVEIYWSNVDNTLHTYFELSLINGKWFLKEKNAENEGTVIIKYVTTDKHSIPEFSTNSSWLNTDNSDSNFKIMSEEFYTGYIEFKKKEAEKKRKAAEEEAEKKRKAVEEAERQRKAAEEEAERQRKATAEEAERLRVTEEAERLRVEEERLAEAAEAEKQRKAATEAEKQRKTDEEAKLQREAEEQREAKLQREAEEQKLDEFKVSHQADTLLDIPDEFITFETEKTKYNEPLTKCVTAYINLCHDRNSKHLMKYVKYFIQLSSSVDFNNIITKTYKPRGNIRDKQVFKGYVLASKESTDPMKIHGQIANVFLYIQSTDYNPFQDFINKTLASSSDYNKPFKLIQVLILFIRNISFYIMLSKTQPHYNKNPESEKDLLQLIEYKYRLFEKTEIIPDNIMEIIYNVYKFALKCYYKFSDFKKPSIMLDNIIMIIHALVFILLLHFHLENTSLLSGGKSTMKHKGKSTMKHKGKSTIKHGGKSTMKHKGKSTMKHGGKSTMKHKGKSTMKHKETRRKYIKGGNIKHTIKIILKNINKTEITNLLVELTDRLRYVLYDPNNYEARAIYNMKINPTIDHHLIHEHVVTHA